MRILIRVEGRFQGLHGFFRQDADHAEQFSIRGVSEGILLRIFIGRLHWLVDGDRTPVEFCTGMQ